MATPLTHLLNGLRNEPTVRADFESSPTEFLHEHGWFELDPADVQEAMFILADAAPTTEAAVWLDAGHAIDGRRRRPRPGRQSL